MASSTTPILILTHGGAGAIPDAACARAEAGTRRAAYAGCMLLASGSALDAVEAAVRVMEDDAHFNAGTGSVLNRSGFVEMDALIMSGCDLRAGAVTCVRNVANPISLARAVLERSPHVFIAGDAAEAFAAANGIPKCAPASLVTPARREQLARVLLQDHIAGTPDPSGTVAAPQQPPPALSGADAAAGPIIERDIDTSNHDTVGAVAMDAAGNVATATSVGGVGAAFVTIMRSMLTHWNYPQTNQYSQEA